MAPNARTRKPAPTSNSAPSNDSGSSRPTLLGRPHRIFRDQVVTHIVRHVHSEEALLSFACCLQRNADVLQRWVTEDVPGFSFAAKAATPDDASPGRALAEFRRTFQERQAAVLVDALREHSSEMTLGDVQSILSGEFGRQLEWVRMRDLQRSEPVRHATPVRPKPHTRPEIDADKFYAQNICSYLESNPGWHSSKDLREQVSDPWRFQDVLARLLRRGLIVRRGRYKTLEFARNTGPTQAQEASRAPGPRRRSK